METVHFKSLFHIENTYVINYPVGTTLGAHVALKYATDARKKLHQIIFLKLFEKGLFLPDLWFC